MPKAQAAREEVKDYYDLAVEELEAEHTNPFGLMKQKHAIVLLRGLQTQNYNDLKQIKDDFPAVWDKYKSKTKNGNWVFAREPYKLLMELAKGETISKVAMGEEL